MRVIWQPSAKEKTTKTQEDMKATTTVEPQGVQLLVSIGDMSMLKDIKKAISMIKGVTKVKTQRVKAKPRLYDPETGEQAVGRP